MNQSATAAIILAAGSSSRMGGGRHKLLLPLADRPVLAHVIDATLQSKARPVIIVLGHQAAQVRERIAPFITHSAITHVENPDYLQGMSTSLRAGLTYLQSMQSDTSQPSDTVDSALVLLGDQPLITARIIDALIDMRRATRASIVAPIYNGKRGNPVLFAANLFSELLQVSGDEGGRTVVERHRQEVATVELGDAMDVMDTMANYDVDTWEAYQQVVELWQQKKTE